VDSLFFYSPAVDDDNNCLCLDDKLEKVASILRSHGYLLFTPRDISGQASLLPLQENLVTAYWLMTDLK
jgi:hypothetical protein